MAPNATAYLIENTSSRRVHALQPAQRRAPGFRSRRAGSAGADPHAVGREALMAERIFLITAIVFGIVVPIAVMVALLYVN